MNRFATKGLVVGEWCAVGLWCVSPLRHGDVIVTRANALVILRFERNVGRSVGYNPREHRRSGCSDTQLVVANQCSKVVDPRSALQGEAADGVGDRTDSAAEQLL